jgi:hypothetical protein
MAGTQPSPQLCRLAPGAARVRNPWHLRALRTACEALNVELLEHVPVLIPEHHGERVESVQLGAGAGVVQS